MRTVVDGRPGTRLLVSGALLLLAFGAPALGGSSAGGSGDRVAAGISPVEGGLVLPPLSGCRQSQKPQLWDNIFPACNE
ncbi:hypothetical protein [Micromonospora sp. CPCC 205561]|uniref:hypothetical protein n=1 Tax=Micromonospora sp. CPCC 205561 TaxID=3122407 RepID=UPI002FEFEAF0